jgi:hypothetical protein
MRYPVGYPAGLSAQDLKDFQNLEKKKQGLTKVSFLTFNSAFLV